MPLVPPGSETGVYYIIVSNLSFKTIWQALKDFARHRRSDGTSYNVEHAYIYPNTGDGWVSVRGRSDFRKAFKHLNGGVLDGRALIADDRNEIQAITIRDVGPSYRSDSPFMNDRYASNYYQSTTSSDTRALAEWSYTQSPTTTPTYTTSLNPGSSTSSNYDPNLPYYSSVPSAPTGMIYAGSVTTPVFVVPSIQPIYPVPLAYPTSTEQRDMQTSSAMSSSDPNNLIHTEARKVIITHINTASSDSEVRELMQWACNARSKDRKIKELDYPRHTDGKPKGHALVVLDSCACASRVVEKLDGLSWAGKTLSARFAKEGVGRGEDAIGGGDMALESRIGKLGVMTSSELASLKKEKKEKGEKGEKEKTRRKGEKQVNTESHKRCPLIVDGTGGRRKK